MTTITIAGSGQVLLAREGETITETIRRAGLGIHDACRRGGCGICRVELRTGEVTYNREVSEQALPTADRAAGIILACRAVPDSDITIALPEGKVLRTIVPMLARLAQAGPEAPDAPRKEDGRHARAMLAAAQAG